MPQTGMDPTNSPRLTTVTKRVFVALSAIATLLVLLVYNPAGLTKLRGVIRTTSEGVVKYFGGTNITARAFTERPDDTVRRSTKEHTIVMFNAPHFMKVSDIRLHMTHHCTLTNCRITSELSHLQNQSAIVYWLTVKLPRKPPISQSDRRPDQVWIFAWTEAPIRHKIVASWKIYMNEYWRHTANWTMSYSNDSDIVIPRGHMEITQTPTAKNYSEIFHRKTNQAAWVVSNCNTPSKRKQYVKQLEKHGLKVDIFGKCGAAHNRVDTDDIRQTINSSYKFYLSFENSLCKDYITEKFFSYYKLDVILVVRGGGHYSQQSPNNTYINTADFPSAKHLARYLLNVASDEERYTGYLRNKDKYVSNDDRENRLQGFCELCKKLNNLDSNRKAYPDVVDAIHNGTCSGPKDL